MAVPCVMSPLLGRSIASHGKLFEQKLVELAVERLHRRVNQADHDLPELPGGLSCRFTGGRDADASACGVGGGSK